MILGILEKNFEIHQRNEKISMISIIFSNFIKQNKKNNIFYEHHLFASALTKG